MRKAKTHQGAAKRLAATPRGKLQRRRQMRGHLKVSKTPKRLRMLRQRTSVHPNDRRRLEALLPYR